jgi:hypothetical protein
MAMAITMATSISGVTSGVASARYPAKTPRACTVVRKSVLERAIGSPLAKGKSQYHEDLFSSCHYDATDRQAGTDLSLEVRTEGYSFKKSAFKKTHGEAAPVPSLGEDAYFAFTKRRVEGLDQPLLFANLQATKGKRGVSVSLSGYTLTRASGLEAATEVARVTFDAL